MGATTNLWMSWRLRLLTNALAVITLVPPLVLSCLARHTSGGSGGRSRRGEAALLAIGLWWCGGSSSSSCRAAREGSGILLYVPFPFLLWAAMRFGLVGASFVGAHARRRSRCRAALRGHRALRRARPGRERDLARRSFCWCHRHPSPDARGGASNERESVDEGRRRIETLHGAVLGFAARPDRRRRPRRD